MCLMYAKSNKEASFAESKMTSSGGVEDEKRKMNLWGRSYRFL